MSALRRPIHKLFGDFLIPAGKAKRATEANMKEFEARRAELEAKLSHSTDNFAAKRMNRNIQRALTGQSVDNI